MDQKKIGEFLKSLRKEKELTQEQLAEHFNVSNRTVSRWETGSNMPDLSILVELSEYYNVDIKEIIDGERKSEIMELEIKETLEKVAEYTNEEKKNQYYKMRNVIGICLISFGIFLIVSVFSIFPCDSSWGSIYSIIGTIIATAGIYQLVCKYKYGILYTVVFFITVAILLVFIDYLGVVVGHQVPRYSYSKEYGDDEITYKAPFYTVIRHNYDRDDESLEIK